MLIFGQHNWMSGGCRNLRLQAATAQLLHEPRSASLHIRLMFRFGANAGNSQKVDQPRQ
jgi:hypothetical protein